MRNIQNDNTSTFTAEANPITSHKSKGKVKKKVKTGYLYSGTVSLTATGGCRLFCSALPVRSA